MLGAIGIVTQGLRPWRAPLPLLFIAFWAVVFLWAPVALLRAPDAEAGRGELVGVVTGGVLALALVATVGSDRRRLRQAQLGWCLGLTVCGTTALFEIATGTHLWVPAEHAWAASSRTIVAGPFHNPNDFAIALTAMISGTLSYRAATVHTLRRRLLAALIVLGVIIVVLTESRGGVLALVLVLSLHGVTAVRARRRRPPARVTRAYVFGFLGLAALFAAAVSLLPSPAQSPLGRLVAAVTGEGTARSDALRIDLVRAALRYFAESDRLGTGAGSFEYLLAADPNPGVSTRTWLHNSFIEILLQYGVVVAAALLGILVAIAVAVMVAARPGATGPPEAIRASRLDHTGAFAALLTFLALGLVAYTALETHVWWIMLAYAVACARGTATETDKQLPSQQLPVEAGSAHSASSSPTTARPARSATSATSASVRR